MARKPGHFQGFPKKQGAGGAKRMHIRWRDRYREDDTSFERWDRYENWETPHITGAKERPIISAGELFQLLVDDPEAAISPGQQLKWISGKGRLTRRGYDMLKVQAFRVEVPSQCAEKAKLMHRAEVVYRYVIRPKLFFPRAVNLRVLQNLFRSITPIVAKLPAPDAVWFATRLVALARRQVAVNRGIDRVARKYSHQVVARERPKYYKDYFGFDLEGDLRECQGMHIYEATFPMRSDPELAAAGVTISAECARPKTGGKVSNRILFRNPKGKQGSVSCVHTAVIPSGDVEWNPKGLENQVSLEFHSLDLAHEDHFAALKSYVAGVAEMGIGAMLRASYYSEQVNPITLPFGFNAAMQAQVIRALDTVAPHAANRMVAEFFADLLVTVPTNWIQRRIDLLNQTYNLLGRWQDDPVFKELVADAMRENNAPIREFG